MNDDLILLALFQGASPAPSLMLAPDTATTQAGRYREAGWRLVDGLPADVLFGVGPVLGDRLPAKAVKVSALAPEQAADLQRTADQVCAAGFTGFFLTYGAEDTQGIWHASGVAPADAVLEQPATLFAFADADLARQARQLAVLYVAQEERIAPLAAQKVTRDVYIAQLEQAVVALQDSDGVFNLGPATDVILDIPGQGAGS